MDAIYDTLDKACPRFKLPSPWQGVPCDPAFFCLPADPGALLTDLRQKFSDADLLKSGVVTIDGEKQIVWHPNLIGNRSPIWAIRKRAKEAAIDLIAMGSTLGKNMWSVVTAFQDHRQQALIDAADNQIFVAYSMTGVAVLRSIGIAAIPGTAWNRLSKPQLDYLCQSLRITTRGSSASARQGMEGRSIALVLANWDMAKFDRADVAAATASWSHLVELEQHLQLEFNSFGLWKPSEKHLKQLDYLLR